MDVPQRQDHVSQGQVRGGSGCCGMLLGQEGRRKGSPQGWDVLGVRPAWFFLWEHWELGLHSLDGEILPCCLLNHSERWWGQTHGCAAPQCL